MPFTLWITGGDRPDHRHFGEDATPVVLATCIAAKLEAQGKLAQVLYEDVFSEATGKRLGFDLNDAPARVRRLREMSRLLNEHGVVSLVAYTSMSPHDSDLNRGLLENYVEVFCDAAPCDALSEAICPPARPDLLLQLDCTNKDACIEKICSVIADRGCMEPLAPGATHAGEQKGGGDAVVTDLKRAACWGG